MSFSSSACEVTLQNVTPDIWNANTLHCLQLIDNETNWQSIPLFNYTPAENIKDLQLVRFRGMIQNMHNSEFFLSKYEIKNIVTGASIVRSGMLKDTIICKENERFVEESEHNENSERESSLCVPIPALNDWVSTSWKRMYLKRQHARSQEEDLEPAKRTSHDVSFSTQPLGSVACESELIFPDPRSRTCYLKLYNCDTTPYVLNDVVEVVGFLSLSDMAEDEEGIDKNVSDSKIPTLHVVSCKNLSQNNLLLPEILRVDEAGSIESVRKDLHLVLTQLLLGDTLAADYLICHLVSSIYCRTEMLALGQLPLNIINIPENNYVRNIYAIVETLVMKSAFLPMSLENLNKKTLNPKKDYEKDHLCEGFLQLSPHTHLVLDETQMQPGKLEALGLINMTALRKLVLEQKVAYDFQYYQIDFNCDIPVLVFSEGKSLLPCSVVVPLESDTTCLQNLPEIFQAVQHFLQPPVLQQIRAYLFSVQSSSSFTLNPEMELVIQKDFVKMRQNKEFSMSADDLHNLMVLARLMSLTVGEEALSSKTWKHVLALETQRKSRLATRSRS